jgi:hypothetical protein
LVAAPVGVSCPPGLKSRLHTTQHPQAKAL